ncbi:MAG: ComF family protein [Flavobacteriales bacterium]
MRERKGHPLLDLVGLFLPRRCAACDQALYTAELAICGNCASDLPLLRGHNDPENRVEQLFRGKVRLESASAFLIFSKGGKVQRMLHRLKYKGDRNVGLELGMRMAEDAMTCPRFASVDLLMAVPLHRDRERQRGYNQAQVLVEGMAAAWDLPMADGGLLRMASTRTQTRKGRMARWGNVKEAFQIDAPEKLEGKHILLVDDVVTTGSTLEGCVLTLQAVPGVRVSVMACACA